MGVSTKDRDTLRHLADKVALIGALPQQRETIKHWKALNGLRPVRPMVTIDQVCWNEMDVDGELELHCETDFTRGIEQGLRRKIYAWRHMPVDMVVDPWVEIPKVIRNDGYGIQVDERVAVLDPTNDVVGHLYTDQLKTEMDAMRIRAPRVSLDQEATARAEETAREIFDGVLPVHLQGVFPAFNPWDQITTWRGAQNVLLDLVDRPALSHMIISRCTDALLAELDQLESQGLLGRDMGLVHCTGAFSDEIPAADYDPERPRARDLWTFGMAQIFGSVSPAMHEEFDIQYARRWYARFGLGYYGCCEPLHRKIGIIRSLPHVRKISMSPWVDQEAGARAIGKDFVFSRKPSPALLAVDTWDPKAVEKDLRTTKEICERYGCPLELILKDISTVRRQPQRLWEWAVIAMRVVRN